MRYAPYPGACLGWGIIGRQIGWAHGALATAAAGAVLVRFMHSNAAFAHHEGEAVSSTIEGHTSR